MAEVTTEKGFKVVRLICVTGANNNKFYNMTQISADEFEAHWGRVDSTETRKNYPMSDWDSIYRDKTKASKKPKPYTDVTHLYAEESVNESAGTTKSIFNKDRSAEVKKFVEMLMKFANQSVEANYTVSASKVTKAQVDHAQQVLDAITGLFKVGNKADEINEKLIELYQIIPRKMKKVQEHLLPEGTSIKDKKQLQEYMNQILLVEQDALDAMAGQVAMNVKEKDATPEQKKEHDLLHTLGLELVDCRPAEIEMIKKMLGPNAKQFVRAFRAVNNQTQAGYDNFLKRAKDKKTALLWHGSRNENWWSIFQQGLKIRPSNAVLTGSMFGYGVYFADKAQKSIGYTSLSGSYWARGGSKTAILALYEIHQGKQKEILNWKSEHSSLDEAKMKRDGYDSVFAKGGADLRNNEYIVYNTNQSTIQYLVEIRD